MKFKLYFTEHHSDIHRWTKLGYKCIGVEADGWGEFEHVQEFEAESVDEAKKKVYDLGEMDNNSSGVFNVTHNGELAFTEEDC